MQKRQNHARDLGMTRAAWSVFLLLLGCRVEMGPPERRVENTQGPQKPSGTVMIYTSMYRHVIEEVKPILARTLPDVEIEWLQAGSEKLGTRLDAELRSGAPRADIVMTSDPLWYERLRTEGHLLPYASIRALSIPRALVHPSGAFVTSRISTMVIAYNEREVPKEDVPSSFADLFTDRWAGRVTMPDPLGSGTTFTTLAFLVHHQGPQIIERMKAAQTVASGGNSSTLTRIESGEHEVGIVLLENVLQAKRNDSPVGFRIPAEGAVLIPGPIAILAKAPNPAAARIVYDELLSQEVQEKIAAGWMHSPFPDVPAPEGAPSLETLLGSEYRWTDTFVRSAASEGQALRRRFAEVMQGP